MDSTELGERAWQSEGIEVEQREGTWSPEPNHSHDPIDGHAQHYMTDDEKTEVLTRILHLQCKNDRNLCFLIATVTAWLWATLSSQDTLGNLWGAHATSIWRWLGALNITEKIALLDAGWLSSLAQE